MNLTESIRIAAEGLRANKVRSLLTMLGIFIGIGSVIAILTVGGGLSGSITSSMSSFGASNIVLLLQSRNASYDMMTGAANGAAEMTADDLITDEMIDGLKFRYGHSIAGIGLSEPAGSGQARDGHRYANVSVSGINEDYMDVNNVTMVQGRSVREGDLVGERNVAIVSDKLVDNMFGGDQKAVLGEELQVSLNNELYTFSIIGVFEYDQSTMGMSYSAEGDVPTPLFIPLTTAKRINGSDPGYQSITVMADSSQNSITFASEIKEFINRYYIDNENFSIVAFSMESVIDQVDSMMNTLNIALSIIAGISLLVGGIGVMNIMLVSVTERTREIGTRKALGATNANIRIQFVVESMIVCLIGGVIGTIFGGLLGYIGTSLLGDPAGPSLSSIVLAVGFSMVIGVFFGYYPANKAAKLDPIEALRYE